MKKCKRGYYLKQNDLLYNGKIRAWWPELIFQFTNSQIYKNIVKLY